MKAASHIVDHFVELKASYVDEWMPGAAAITELDRVLRQPKEVEEENYADGGGAWIIVTTNRQCPSFAEEMDVCFMPEYGLVAKSNQIWFEGPGVMTLTDYDVSTAY